VIRGDKNDNAVLCTSDKTFDLKDTETSNSLLIMKSLKFPKDVEKYKQPDAARIIETKIVI
jgi:sister chromatid cohesion protein DCC1